jgi:hypothetical protein
MQCYMYKGHLPCEPMTQGLTTECVLGIAATLMTMV